MNTHDDTEWIPFATAFPPSDMLVVWRISDTVLPATTGKTFARFEALYGAPAGDWREASAEVKADYAAENARIAALDKGNNYAR